MSDADVSAPTAEAPKPAAKPAKSPKKKHSKPKSKKPANHPKYSEMIAAAIGSLKERGGSSRQAILKYIIKSYKVDKDAKIVNAHLKMALRAGSKNGTLKHTKGSGALGSFKLGEKNSRASAKATSKTLKKKTTKKTPKKPRTKKVAGEKKTKTAKSPKKTAKPKKAATPKKTKSPKKAAKPKVKKAKKPAAKK